MLWCSIEFIVICINKRGLHPVASLVIDLLQTLKLAVVMVFDFMWYNNYDGSSNGVPLCETGDLNGSFGVGILVPIDCGMWRAGLVCGIFCVVAW
jgi:hypothetical protein